MVQVVGNQDQAFSEFEIHIHECKKISGTIDLLQTINNGKS